MDAPRLAVAPDFCGMAMASAVLEDVEEDAEAVRWSRGETTMELLEVIHCAEKAFMAVAAEGLAGGGGGDGDWDGQAPSYADAEV
ncbi:hypothetical protein HKX48_006077 [Thoreauomyces humboldtii]|nr:hypothetical protein HKX48_006077 [Thoreauomyces humboldtii]